MIRRLCTFAVLVAVAASCSSPSPATPGSSTSAASAPASAAPSEVSAAPSEAAAPVEITFVSNITPTTTVAYWTNLMNLFEASHPGVTVKLLNPPNLVEGFMSSLIAAGNAPDVADNAITDPKLWPELLPFDLSDPDLQQVKNLDLAKINGQLLALGSVIQATGTLIFYNKDLFTKAGVTAVPTTWSELDSALAQLKAANVTPMITSGDFSTIFTLGCLASDVFAKNPHWYADRHAGKVHFTDQDWVDAVNRLQQYARAGYFQGGAVGMSYPQEEQAFLSGAGAMYPMGSWFTGSAAARPPSFEIGVFPCPNSTGKPVLGGEAAAGGFSVFKTTKSPKEAFELAKFLSLDPEAHKAFLVADGQFSDLVNPPQMDLTPLQTDTFKLLQDSAFVSSIYGQGDNSPVAGVVGELDKMAQNAVVGPIDTQKALAAIDALWEKNK